jgi:23S rRNA (adenine2503-C2)-methyltransferase
MGMGEAMHNFEAVSAAVEIMTHPQALVFSPRRLVVSTVGEIDRLAAFHRRFPRVGLAVSINAATDDLRSSLMPINNKFNLRAIAEFILSLTLARGDTVTLEYVVLAGVNDTPRQTQALAGYLKPLARRVKVNLIAFNPVEGLEFRSPNRDSMLRLQEALRSVGVMTFIRRSRGKGIGAACGQLAGRM